MKKQHIYIVALCALMGSALSASAQETYSGYFVDGYEYRFRMNPAFGNGSHDFIAVPALGNANAAMRGNLHLRNVIYNVDGKTTTLLNPKVTVDEVMNNLNDVNKLGAYFNVTLLSAGFNAWGGYNTVNISARANANVKVPKELFRLVKEGVANETYSITDAGAKFNSFGEIAFGHSRDLNSKWRVGGNLKFLLGIANMEAKLNQATLNLGKDTWSITSEAEVHTSVKGLQYEQKVNDRTYHKYVSGAKVDGGGLNGFGMAVDLGAAYTPNEDWQFSAALLDLGWIHWNNNMVASTNGVRSFTTDKYVFNPEDSSDNSFKKEWDKIKDDLSTLYELENNGDAGCRNTSLAATLNFGARYTAPFYRKLDFGLVNTTSFYGDYAWTDFRLSANVAPVEMFSASANFALGTYGAGFGWLLNYHYTGFGLFVGMDHTLGKVTKQFVPLSSNGSFNLGMNILF